MSDVMMKALQLQVESLTRQVEVLGPENERVRKLLDEFSKRHDADEARITSLEAQLADAQSRRVDAFHEDQVRIWAQEILEALALHDQYRPETYEDKVVASQVVERELTDIGKAVSPRPVTVREAARALHNAMADGEVWRIAVNAALPPLRADLQPSAHVTVDEVRDALTAALRALQENQDG